MNKRKLIAASLTGAFLLSAMPVHASDIEDRLVNAASALSDVESFSSHMNMDIFMTTTQGDQTMTIPMSTSGEITIFQSPVKAKTIMTIDMGEAGGSQETTSYMEETEDGISSYTQYGDTWFTSVLPADSLQQYQVADNISLYLDNATSFQEAGEEEVNGQTATRLDGVLSGDSMSEVLGTSGLSDILASLGALGIDPEGMLSDIKDTAISIWLDENDIPVKYEIDMTETLNEMLDTIMSAASSEDLDGVSLSFDRVCISMTVENLNAAEDFEIPEEARSGQSMEDFLSSSATDSTEEAVEDTTETAE